MSTTVAEPAPQALEPARALTPQSRKKADRPPDSTRAFDEPDYVPSDFSASRPDPDRVELYRAIRCGA